LIEGILCLMEGMLRDVVVLSMDELYGTMAYLKILIYRNVIKFNFTFYGKSHDFIDVTTQKKDSTVGR